MIKKNSYIPLHLTVWLCANLIMGSTCVYANKYNFLYHKKIIPLDVSLGKLSTEKQDGKVFSGKKIFADDVATYNRCSFFHRWKHQKTRHDFHFKNLFKKKLMSPHKHTKSLHRQSLRQYINGLWPKVTHNFKYLKQNNSLLHSPKSHSLSGRHLQTVYYWNNYFTMLGLAENGRWDLVQNMVDNVAYEIDQYGSLSSRKRSHYLSRSQPPFFSCMIDLLASHKGPKVYRHYFPQLRKEYHYWIQNSKTLAPGQAKKNVIKLSDGTILNRYWDDRDELNTVSLLKNRHTVNTASYQDQQQIKSNLQASAVSGWNLSSRWLGDKKTLQTINTTDLAPIDLNSLLFHLEKTLFKAATLSKKDKLAKIFMQYAKKRQKAINRYLWNEKQGWYADYDWKKNKLNNQLTSATLFPLYVQLTNQRKATRIALSVEKNLLKNGGLLTTTVHSNQQWDAPNGWAPLQWIAIKGLEYYKKNTIANKIGYRFLKNVQQTYDRKHKLFEKYIVEGHFLGGSTARESSSQNGLGWTNGVTLMLLDKYCPKNKSCNSAHDIPNISYR